MRFGKHRSFLYGILVLLGLLLPTFSATAQTVRRWREPEKYDNGAQPSVAVLSTGLVVEFHRSPSVFGIATIWYHIGKVSHGTIQWGPSREMKLKTKDLAWPQVVVTPQGQVIFTCSDWTTSLHSDLIYWTGRVDPNGDTSQTIDWVQKEVNYDGGFHNNLALAPFYTYGVFADVHEAKGSGNGLYYRIGHLNSDLILLCYKATRRQQGQRGRDRARWVAIRRRRVAIECGLCRSVLGGRASGREC